MGKNGQDWQNLFIWQSEYRKKWTTYSEEDILAINRALSSDQLCAILKESGKNKNVTIDLKRMVQINNKSRYERRIRCLVYNDGFYAWFWESDKKSEWTSYHPYVALSLELSHQKKKKEVEVKFFNNKVYNINLENFMELEAKTQTSRPVKRENIAVSSAPWMEDLIKNSQNCIESTSLPLSLDLGNSSKMNQVSSNDDDDSSAIANATVDAECPSKEDYHICCRDGTVYNATLNLACLQNNNNKFYLIQLLEHNVKKAYSVWRRWGRVGIRGQVDFTTYGTNFEAAKLSFEKKFLDKTKNRWSDRKEFVQVSGKYDLLLMDTSSESSKPPEVKRKRIEVPSKLPSKVQSLLELIFDKTLMEDNMKEMSYNLDKTPLGKLTAKQVKDGYIALNKITDAINRGGKHSELLEACNEFYTKIPHSFGMKIPPIIRTRIDVENKIKMLEALSNITVAMGVLNTASTKDENILDKYYGSLECILDVLTPSASEFQAIEKCIKETHGPTHNTYNVEIVDVFACRKSREESSFVESDKKFLLWHGSRITNWVGILKEGLRIAPPEAPVSGYMFGKGVYFADVYSKSANYCCATKRKNEGLLLMCEVSVGNQYELDSADSNLPRNLPSNYNSVLGCGRVNPTDFEFGLLSSKAKSPVGPLVEKPSYSGSLYYNEYIVYDVNQVKMKYLIRVKFNFK